MDKVSMEKWMADAIKSGARHLYVDYEAVDSFEDLRVFVDVLKKYPQITDVKMGSYKVNDEGALLLSELTQLTALDVTGCYITAKGMKHLTKLTNLKKLYIANNRDIGDEGAEYIAGMPNLIDVQAYSNCIGSQGQALIDETVKRNRDRAELGRSRNEISFADTVKSKRLGVATGGNYIVKIGL